MVKRVADAAVGVEDDQHVLRPPHPELARRLARLRVEGRTEKPRLGRMGDVDDHHAAVRHVFVAPVGAAPDVDVVSVDRERSVHPAIHERLVSDLLE